MASRKPVGTSRAIRTADFVRTFCAEILRVGGTVSLAHDGRSRPISTA
jgi:hypothetical protein